MPKLPINYSKTFIYKLCCNDLTIKDIYIGHTTNLIQRKNQHNTACNTNHPSKVYSFINEHGGFSNWSMIQLEKFSCNNKREAEAKEREWIEKLNASLNCNNPYALYVENPIQYKKDWYEEKKDIILQNRKIDYIDNKDKKLEYQKEYYQENKDKIKNYNKEYCEINKEKIKEDKKIYRENNKEKIQQCINEWNEKNKDKINTKNKEICNCECGCKITIYNKRRHLMTKIHLEYSQKKDLSEEELKENENKKLLETQIKIQQQIEQKKIKNKEYIEANKEEISIKKKAWNEKNKEKIKEQCKKYYEENKEKIISKEKELYEKNKEKIKEYKKEYYEKNKEQILEKNKQSTQCMCGTTIKYSGMASHVRSNKHIEYCKSISKNEELLSMQI
jgi:hypothetical protein